MTCSVTPLRASLAERQNARFFFVSFVQLLAVFAPPRPVSFEHVFPAKAMPEKVPGNFGNVCAYQHMDTLKHGGTCIRYAGVSSPPFPTRCGVGHTEGAPLGLRLRLPQFSNVPCFCCFCGLYCDI